MKHILLLILLAVSSFSFRQEETADKGAFVATVDGEAFRCQNKMFRGILVTKDASMDGRSPARNVISTNFKGPSYDNNGSTFAEAVEIEINQRDSKVGPAGDYNIVLQYKNTNYYLLKEQSKLNITQLNYEADKKHFWMNAEFDCKMRSMGYPNDNKKDVSLKGRMTDIRVTVPSWIAAKL